MISTCVCMISKQNPSRNFSPFHQLIPFALSLVVFRIGKNTKTVGFDDFLHRFPIFLVTMNYNSSERALLKFYICVFERFSHSYYGFKNISHEGLKQQDCKGF